MARRTHPSRQDSVLLDLFLATLLFASCALVVGQFGMQSLQLATRSGLERLANSQALSKLSEVESRKELLSPKDSIRESSKLGGIPVDTKIDWQPTSNPSLWIVRVRIMETSSKRSESAPLAEVSRWVFLPRKS